MLHDVMKGAATDLRHKLMMQELRGEITLSADWDALRKMEAWLARLKSRRPGDQAQQE